VSECCKFVFEGGSDFEVKHCHGIEREKLTRNKIQEVGKNPTLL
jgi:hypothetical protein